MVVWFLRPTTNSQGKYDGVEIPYCSRDEGLMNYVVKSNATDRLEAEKIC